MYGQVFKEPGDLVFTTSFLGAFFLISQVAFYYEIIGLISGGNFPFPENAIGVIITLFIITLLNAYIIKKKVILDEIEIRKPVAILVYLYLMSCIVITLIMYFNFE